MGCGNSSFDTPCNLRSIAKDAKQFDREYVLDRKIGRGSYAQVRAVEDVDRANASSSRSRKAVKIMDMGRQNETGETSAHKLVVIQNEAKIWGQVSDNRHIVRLHDFFIGSSLSLYVMERCSSGLMPHLMRLPSATERDCGQIFHGMLLGVSHIHGFEIVHCDIKPDNFMIGDDGSTVKLCDFGLSVHLPRKRLMYGVRGTAPFMCPEMLENGGYGAKADMWSLGVIVYAILFGSFPFEPKLESSKKLDVAKAMKKAILEGVAPRFAPGVEFSTSDNVSSSFRTDSAVSLAKKLLNRRPGERLSAAEALCEEYMSAISENRHEVGVNLPNLQPMILAASKKGAFEKIRLEYGDDDIDELLRSLGMLKKDTSPNLEHGNQCADLQKTSPDTPFAISESTCTPSTISSRGMPESEGAMTRHL